jgi:hypothetical protein
LAVKEGAFDPINGIFVLLWASEQNIKKTTARIVKTDVFMIKNLLLLIDANLQHNHPPCLALNTQTLAFFGQPCKK